MTADPKRKEKQGKLMKENEQTQRENNFISNLYLEP